MENRKKMSNSNTSLVWSGLDIWLSQLTSNDDGDKQKSETKAKKIETKRQEEKQCPKVAKKEQAKTKTKAKTDQAGKKGNATSKSSNNNKRECIKSTLQRSSNSIVAAIQTPSDAICPFGLIIFISSGFVRQ